MDLKKSIIELKKRKNAVILVHNYQLPELYDVADFIGDSLELSMLAKQTKADIIVFCGVDFMAESAKILNPNKKVLLPSKLAKCPMANMVQIDKLLQLKSMHKAKIVSYINTNAQTKAISDICCTSANSVEVINSLDSEKIIFVPDKNLADYTQRFTKKKIIPWHGFCYVHNKISFEMIGEAKKSHPKAIVIAHPECNPRVIDAADFVTSTSGMIKNSRENESHEFIIATECGMVERLKMLMPTKKFYSSGGICLQMKKNSLQKVFECLSEEKNEIILDKDLMDKARIPLERMLKIKSSKG